MTRRPASAQTLHFEVEVFWNLPGRNGMASTWISIVERSANCIIRIIVFLEIEV
jgi:hypothetical protein